MAGKEFNFHSKRVAVVSSAPPCLFLFGRHVFLGVFLILAGTVVPATAQFRTLVEFEGVSGTNKGADPVGMVLANDGNFYGTTCQGGALGYGTVFRLTPDGKLTTLVEFTGPDGAVPGNFPEGTLIQAKDGNLYGTTQGYEGAKFGTIYRVSLSGQYTLLARFDPQSASDGIASWIPGLIQARDGNFYGVLNGGGKGSAGSIYRYSPDGKIATLYNFQIEISSHAMAGPYGRFFEASDGSLIGTTSIGGDAVTGGGAIYRVTPDGHVGFITAMRGYSHDSTGGGLEDGVIQASDGNFYGAAPVFGRFNFGALYRVTPQGEVSNLVNFTGFGPGRNGSSPIKPLVQGPDGALYGSAQRDGPSTHFGTIFRVTLDGQFTTLVNLTGIDGPYKGKQVGGPLIATQDGTLYGTTEAGGAHDDGTIFALKPTTEMLAHAQPPDATARGTTEATPSPAAPAASSAPNAALAPDSSSHQPIIDATFSSPDGVYSLTMQNKPWLAPDKRPGFDNYHVLVLSKGGTEIKEYPTWRELTGAFWSADGKYLAANNLRSDMGGDQLWIFSLPDGEVVKQPDDATARAWMRTGVQALARHFPFEGDKGYGKAFVSLFATGWDGDEVKFTVERNEAYDHLRGFYDFDGEAAPSGLPVITSSSMKMHGDGSLTATNARDLTMKEQILGWWASAHHAYWFKDDGLCYAQGSGKGSTSWDFRDGVYYENGTPFDVVSLTGSDFVCRTRGPAAMTVRLTRIGKADAAKY